MFRDEVAWFLFDAKAVSELTAVQANPDDDTLVQQHFRDEVDVNTIMRRFGQTGQIPYITEGMYGDFSDISDYDSALAKVGKAEEAFMKLPADLRDKFGNSPGKFIERAVELGLPEMQREINRATMPVPVVAVVPVVAPTAPVP